VLIPCVVTVAVDWTVDVEAVPVVVVDLVVVFVDCLGGSFRTVAAWADGAKNAARATTVNRDTITLNFFN
jgi:hypothetical protein